MNRNMESFRREGGRTVIGLEGNSRIEQDREAKHSVAVYGIEVARDLATFCPLDAGPVAFYALKEQELSAPLPRNRSAANIAAIAVSTE